MDKDDVQIGELKAHEFHATWIRLQNDHQAEIGRLNRIKNNADNSPEDQDLINTLLQQSPEEEEQYLKDKLFIETGEDVEDLFIAFKYYKLV
mmetsp:Transcript_19175/g.29366  ORF Transcript_19175/g.29366 Transcript_19175/m.29366 type:complete len:92 (-) Transcript_19175:27-302(-)